MKYKTRSPKYSSSNLLTMTWKMTSSEALVTAMKEWDQTLKSSNATFALFPTWRVAFEIEGNLRKLTLTIRLWPDISAQ